MFLVNENVRDTFAKHLLPWKRSHGNVVVAMVVVVSVSVGHLRQLTSFYRFFFLHLPPTNSE